MMDNFKQDLITAVNRKIAGAREALHSGGIDAKRPQAWCEFGFPENIALTSLFQTYDRHPLAFAAIDKRGAKVWSDNPWVIEGEETEDDKKTSPLEAAITSMAKRTGLWEALHKADEYRMIAGWAAIIIRVADGGTLRDPVTKRVTLDSVVEFIPVYASQIKASAHEIVAGEKVITHYQYTEPSTDLASTTIKDIHADRVVIVGNPLTDRSLLRAGYNELINLEKISGGSGESFLKNASRAISINYGKDADFAEIARMYGKTPEQMHEVLNEVARDINMSIDTVLATQDASVSTLTVAIADPGPSFEVASQAFAASVNTPVKVLIGNVTGERASTEDNKEWAGTCQGWRNKQAGNLVRGVINRLIKWRALTLPNFSVIWTDLRESSPTERAVLGNLLADIAQKMATAKQTASVLGNDVVIKEDEIRTVLGYETIEEA